MEPHLTTPGRWLILHGMQLGADSNYRRQELKIARSATTWSRDTTVQKFLKIEVTPDRRMRRWMTPGGHGICPSSM
jgi:hypothetical protein